jgi:hypothetical protein
MGNTGSKGRQMTRKYAAGAGGAGTRASVGPPARVVRDAGTRDTLAKLFGRNLSDADVRSLMGAPRGSTVDLSSHGTLIFAKLYGPGYEPNRPAQDGKDPRGAQYQGWYYLTKQPDGVHVLAEYFRIHAAGVSRIGLQITRDQVKAAPRFGIRVVNVRAGRHDPQPSSGEPADSRMTGYYHWPLLGFDGVLSQDIRARAAADGFGRVRTVQELLSKPGSRPWWRRHGEGMKLSFRVRPGDRYWRRMDSELRRLGLGGL